MGVTQFSCLLAIAGRPTQIIVTLRSAVAKRGLHMELVSLLHFLQFAVDCLNYFSTSISESSAIPSEVRRHMV